MKPLVLVALWPSGFITRSGAAPAMCGGVNAVIEVELTTLAPLSTKPSSSTIAPFTKPLPVMVSEVPPAMGPSAGVIVPMVGAGFGVYVKPLAMLPACASGFVTVIGTVPATPGGAIAVIEALLATTTFVARALPTVTVAPTRKLLPVSVIAVPPFAGPLGGATVESVGAGRRL